MIYKLGKVVATGKNYLIFESNYTGYVIQTYNVEKFEKDKFQKIFIYENDTEYNHSFYGFKEFKERLFFEDLLTIQGIGPKTALSVLSQNYEDVLYLISNGDYEELSKLPYIGTKIARQIVLEFQSKYQTMLSKKNDSKNKIELSKTLKTLGFNSKQIELATKNVAENENLDVMIEQAIEIISNEHHDQTIKA